jgi:hypothetical protein
MLAYMLVAAVSAAQIGQVVTLPAARRSPDVIGADVGMCYDGTGVQ